MEIHRDESLTVFQCDDFQNALIPHDDGGFTYTWFSSVTRRGVKDTSVRRRIWSRWPGSFALSRKPKRWAGKGNHDAPSANKHKTQFI